MFGFKVLSFNSEQQSLIFDFSKLLVKLDFFDHQIKLKILSLDINTVIESHFSFNFHFNFFTNFPLIYSKK